MKYIIDEIYCTGCAACANVCPNGAIEIVQDKNGYYRSVIKEDKCTDCGLCKKSCPILNYKEENTKQPDAYALMNEDNIRIQSSSGGAFTALANWIFERNGYVVGAAFNKNWMVEHIIIDTIDELHKIRGSKYVQSKISENLYKQIKYLLDNGNYVLFSGCPCQVAGLKHYLNKKYDKLLLVDIYCTYSPSPKVFQKFINEVEQTYDKITDINFRDKKLSGWNCSSIVVETIKNKQLYKKYMQIYHSKIAMSKSCENCKFATLPRQSDITIADFWGIKKFNKNLDDKLGTSLLLINTSNGERIFNDICKTTKLKTIKQVPLKYAMQRACQKPFAAHPLRDKFYNLIASEKSFNEVYEKTLGKQNNIGILNFWYVPNRGAILTNYALNEFLKEEGYNVKTINYYPRIEKRLHKNSISEKFEKEFLTTTNFCADYIDLKNLNKNIGTFIVGSDQVFRDWCVHHHRDKYFLNFANDNAKKIACAASFGIPFYDGEEGSKNIMRKYLQRFDAISVRETSGVEILQNTFNINSTQIWDPVFYINKEKYEKIAQTSKKKDSKFLAYYIITMTPAKKKAINYTANKLGLKAVNMKGKLPVEDWLYYIKNCDYYVGDSFHGTCFALLFNKNFFVISPRIGETDTRLDTLLKTVKLENRQLKLSEEIYSRNDLFNNIDYSNRFSELNSEIMRSKKWLLDAIESDSPDKNFSENDKLFFAQMDRLNVETAENTRRIELVKNQHKIFIEYIKCTFLKKIVFKKKLRDHYKLKYKILSLKMKELKSLNY